MSLLFYLSIEHLYILMVIKGLVQVWFRIIKHEIYKHETRVK